MVFNVNDFEKPSSELRVYASLAIMSLVFEFYVTIKG
jgi:hypothetical protein